MNRPVQRNNRPGARSQLRNLHRLTVHVCRTWCSAPLNLASVRIQRMKKEPEIWLRFRGSFIRYVCARSLDSGALAPDATGGCAVGRCRFWLNRTLGRYCAARDDSSVMADRSADRSFERLFDSERPSLRYSERAPSRLSDRDSPRLVAGRLADERLAGARLAGAEFVVARCSLGRGVRS